PKIVGWLNPIALRRAISRVRSLTDMAIVLAATHSRAKTTAVAVMLMNPWTLPIISMNDAANCFSVMGLTGASELSKAAVIASITSDILSADSARSITIPALPEFG